jgi:AraC-like DNA-binding protein
VSFDKDFTDKSIYQDALLLLEFNRLARNAVYYSLTELEFEAVNRLYMSVRYDLVEQPDNYWILRTRYFIISLLFTATADFYINCRQYELYKDPLVARVASYFWDHLGDEITLDSVLKRFSVNKNTLNEAFNNEVSMSCMAYLEALRVDLAKKILQFGDEPVSEICQICGYSEINYFSKVFKKLTGQTPTEYRRQLKGLC